MQAVGTAARSLLSHTDGRLASITQLVYCTPGDSFHSYTQMVTTITPPLVDQVTIAGPQHVIQHTYSVALPLTLIHSFMTAMRRDGMASETAAQLRLVVGVHIHMQAHGCGHTHAHGLRKPGAGLQTTWIDGPQGFT